MNSKKIILWIILLAGLVFSSTIRLKFNLHGGFTFSSLWFTLIPIPLFDYGNISPINLLTTTVVGYLFYIAYGIIFLISGKHRFTLIILIVGLLSLSIIGSAIEISTFLHDINGQYVGRHLRMGPTIFILGLYSMIQIKSKR
jgi:hypothetical protein